MLILTRKIQETMMIGDGVNITILGIKGNQVRLGINAPASIAVHRKEVYLRIKEEQEGLFMNPESVVNDASKKMNSLQKTNK